MRCCLHWQSARVEKAGAGEGAEVVAGAGAASRAEQVAAELAQHLLEPGVQ